jgi:hypothetical protein
MSGPARPGAAISSPGTRIIEISEVKIGEIKIGRTHMGKLGAPVLDDQINRARLVQCWLSKCATKAHA